MEKEKRLNEDKKHVLFLSYGKNSMACLGAIKVLGWDLDKVVNMEIYATDDMLADKDEVIEFKKRADKKIKDMFGIEVEHIRAPKTFEDYFYSQYGSKSKREGQIWGFPTALSRWCVSHLIERQLIKKEDEVSYFGASCKPARKTNSKNSTLYPLLEIGWTDEQCLKWCEDNELLSPVYKEKKEVNCWFCPFQDVDSLRNLYLKDKGKWNLLLKWGEDSPIPFKPSKVSIADFDKRFRLEDKNLVPNNQTFRWVMMDDYTDDELKLKREPQHVLSFSYGKDSMACLGAIEKLGWKLDRIVHAEIWATKTVSANLPEMVKFKSYADKIIKERWGIEVEHIKSEKTFEECFYRKFGNSRKNSQFKDSIYGWPLTKQHWCVGELKMSAIRKCGIDKNDINYIGIALDEPERFRNLDNKHLSPLKELGWTEADCRQWCKDNDLLSPVYETSARDGCFFCIFQGVNQLRRLYHVYPELWALMMRWDNDSSITFKPHGITVHHYDKRFKLEDKGLLPTDGTFRWKMLDEY